jgi:hypothetical protein
MEEAPDLVAVISILLQASTLRTPFARPETHPPAAPPALRRGRSPLPAPPTRRPGPRPSRCRRHSHPPAA